jgi:hypothetical protein
MTTVDFTTAAVVVPVSFPDLAANVQAAQHAGDLAYTACQRAGSTPAEGADAYHGAYTRHMAALGTPMPCECAGCFWLNFDHRAEVAQ